MPPKTVFTKDDVIQAGFEIIQEQGFQALTAREVARALKSSTAPVYSNFESMRLLEKEVLLRANALQMEYMTRSYTDRVFLNMGIGYAIFAREQCRLFRALYLEKSENKDLLYDLEKSMRSRMVKDTRLSSLTDQERHSLLDKMWIFTHGMATMICVGLAEDNSDEYITKTLMDVGSAVIGAVFMNKQSNQEQQ